MNKNRYWVLGLLVVVLSVGGLVVLKPRFHRSPSDEETHIDYALAYKWTTPDWQIQRAPMSTTEILRAKATSEARITERTGAEMTTVAKGKTGGGMVVHAQCRQSFMVLEVLAGNGQRGTRELQYSFLELKSGGPFPYLGEEAPIPRGAMVVLFIEAHGKLTGVIDDTEKKRQLIEGLTNRVRNRPPVATAFLRSVDSLILTMEYRGPDQKSYPNLLCSTRSDLPYDLPAGWLVMQNLSPVWVWQALDHLVERGVLSPVSPRAEARRPRATERFYCLTLTAKGCEKYEYNLGWGRETYEFIEALGKAMEYDNGMTTQLLARLKDLENAEQKKEPTNPS
jgi:hypothetical protein